MRDWQRVAVATAAFVVLTALVVAAGAAGFAWWYAKPIDTGHQHHENPLRYPRHVAASLGLGLAAAVAALAVVSPAVAAVLVRGRRHEGPEPPRTRADELLGG